MGFSYTSLQQLSYQNLYFLSYFSSELKSFLLLIHYVCFLFSTLLGHPLPAVQHLLAAKYLIELMGGPRHPELVTVYFRLVGIYDEVGDYVTALRCLTKAKRLSPNVAKQCMISATIAEMHAKMGNLALAVTEQRGVIKVMEQLFGVEDEKTIEAKGREEVFLRKLTTDNVNLAKEAMALKNLGSAADKNNGTNIIVKEARGGDVEVGVVKTKKSSGCKKNKKGKK